MISSKKNLADVIKPITQIETINKILEILKKQYYLPVFKVK